jgi:branched-chain amino acid aminotransferase
MKRFAYFNGKIVPAEKVVIPMTDIGFLRGFGIFDYAKVYSGVPFLLKEHIVRFKNSAAKLGLKLPKSPKEIEAITLNLLEKSLDIKKSLKQNKKIEPFAAVRMILTGGPALGLGFNDTKQTFIIVIEECKPMASEYYTKGGILMTYEHERIFPDIKTLNYATAVKLQKERAKKKAVEILYTSHGKILEATTSNFFLLNGNTLITSQNQILIGITRNHVMDLAHKAGFTIEERDIMLNELKEADEAFITASNKEVLPIVRIDELAIGNGKVGEKTKQLISLFQASIQNYVTQRNRK